MSDLRCSDFSRAANEPLAATATTAEHWLLVEVRGGWPRDVGSPTALPEGAREAVAAWLERTPGSRLLFIRRPGRPGGPSLSYVVHAPESAGSVRRFEIDDLEGLANVDLENGGESSGAPIVLVCGHGSRDACCALRGTAVFGALVAGFGEEELWISSHQGGHRFAPNLIVLPAAVQLGRVEPAEAPQVLGTALNGGIELGHYRGRTCYTPPVQAADRAIRESLGFVGVGDLRLVDVSGPTVRFAGPDGAQYAAEVSEVTGPSVPVSCGTEPEPQAGFAARLVRASGATPRARTSSR